MSKDELKKGDHVEWETSQGTTSGTVEGKITSDMKIKSHQVRASPDDPQFRVKSDKTGAEAAHKPDALKKVGGKSSDDRPRGSSPGQ
ncbi:MAG: DUF2945 domain-containing protein [Candidatus Limnocylindrales bacterium]